MVILIKIFYIKRPDYLQSGLLIEVPCVDEKDAKSFIARKERNVCKGNLSRGSLAFQ